MGDLSTLADAEDSQGLSVQLPFRLGRYTLCRELGAGGMATVYLGRMKLAEGFERLVALKTIHGHLAKAKPFVDMFLDEANIASQIGHPNVCSVYDFGNVGGTYYLALEYLMGEPLDDFINAVVAKRDDDLLRTLPYLAARILADACKGLQAAHATHGSDGQALNVIHRDVSPQNLFVTYDGSVKVVDFGCAKAVERVTQTDTGIMKGKVSYAAPEQLRGEPLDARVDVWALGVCLWETLTLRELFRRETAIQSAMAVLEEEIPRADDTADWVPKELADIAERALRRDRNERYESAKDMGRDLRQFIAKAGVSFESAELAEWMGHLFLDRQEEIRRMVSEVEAGARDTSAKEARGEPTGSTGISAEVSGIGDAATALAKLPSGRANTTSRQPESEPAPPSDAPGVTWQESAPRQRPRLSEDEPVTLPTRSRAWVWVALLLLVGAGAFGGLWHAGDGDPAAGWAQVMAAVSGASAATPAAAGVPEVTIDVERVPVADMPEQAVPEETAGAEAVPEEAAGAEAVPEQAAGAASTAGATPDPEAQADSQRASWRERSGSGGTTTTTSSGSGSATAATPAPSPAPAPLAPGRTNLDTSQGQVAVEADPGWAEVVHEGRSLGRTPLRVSLPVGTQRLRLLPYGREPAQVVNVPVEWGAVNRIRIRLADERPAPAPAPPREEPPAPRPTPPATDNPYEQGGGGGLRETGSNPYEG